MTTTVTATAMQNVARDMPSGAISRSVRWFYPSAVDITASANALRAQLLKVPNGATINYLDESHSCGAATCPVDFGIKDEVLSLSRFMSQVTQGVVNQAAAMKLPYTIDITDTQATQYAYLTAGFTPGTATAEFEICANVIYSLDGLN